MRYDDILSQLPVLLPELEESISAVHQDWGSEVPGVYNVLDEAWGSFIERTEDPEILGRAFEFIERLCASTDQKAREVGAEYYWGQLGGTPLLERVRPHLRDCTQAFSDKQEVAWQEAHDRRENRWWRRMVSRLSRKS